MLSHDEPERLARSTTAFTFVLDGVESAIEQARSVAGDACVADTPGGVAAAREGFAAVIGVAARRRAGRADLGRADVVVRDLAELVP